jgi:hypothetical protein
MNLQVSQKAWNFLRILLDGAGNQAYKYKITRGTTKDQNCWDVQTWQISEKSSEYGKDAPLSMGNFNDGAFYQYRIIMLAGSREHKKLKPYIQQMRNA